MGNCQTSKCKISNLKVGDTVSIPHVKTLENTGKRVTIKSIEPISEETRKILVKYGRNNNFRNLAMVNG